MGSSDQNVMQEKEVAKGRGGGGNRGVRGVDFGLGIGFNPECKSTPSNAVPSRSASVNSLKTGMMAQFRSSFVAASSGSQNAGMSNSSGMYANKKAVLPGFVSGGSIGGIHTAQTSSSVNSTPVYSGTSSQSRENASQKNSESSKDRGLLALARLDDVDELKFFKKWESTCSSYDKRLANTAIDFYLKRGMIDEVKKVFHKALKRCLPFYWAGGLFMSFFLEQHQIDLAPRCLEAALSEVENN